MDDPEQQNIEIRQDRTPSVRNRRRSDGLFQRLVFPGIAVVALMLAVVAILGSSKNGGSGSVAIIDLDRVANELGKGAELDEMIRVEAETAAAALQKQAAEYKRQLESKQTGLPSIVDLQTQSRLNAEADKLGKELQARRDQVAEDLKRKRIEYLTTFREEVKPYAEIVAKKRGLSVIFTENSSVVYSVVAPSVEITDDVIAMMRAGGEAVAPGDSASSAEAPVEE